MKNWKGLRPLIAAALAGALLLLAGCEKTPDTTSSQTPAYPVNAGNASIAQRPASVVSLSPSLTEILCELGYQDRLQGRTIYCDYPQGLEDIPTVGSGANPDIEGIVALKPDLLLTQTPLSKKDVTTLSDSDITVVMLSPGETYGEVQTLYTTLATIMEGYQDGPEDAAKAFQPIDDALKAAQEKIKDSSETFVYVMSAEGNVATGDTLAGNLFGFLCKNVAMDGADCVYDLDKIKEADPDFIIVSASVGADQLPLIGFDGLTALAKGNVIEVEETGLERQSARMMEEVNKAADFIAEKQSEQAEASSQQESGSSQVPEE